MIKQIICLPSIESEFNTDFSKRYKKIAYDAINGIYNMLVHHPLFMSQVNCTYNSKDDVKIEFDNHVANFLIITYGNFNNTSDMEAYNIMTSDNKFYSTWKKDLFEYIINNH